MLPGSQRPGRGRCALARRARPGAHGAGTAGTAAGNFGWWRAEAGPQRELPWAGGRSGRGHRAGWRCQAPRRPRSGGGGPRLLSGVCRRGAYRRFLCPSFRFPLARPRHSWRESGGGGGSRSGTSLAGRATGRPFPAPGPPLAGLERSTAPQARAHRPQVLGQRPRPGTPQPCRRGCPRQCRLGLAVGGSGREVPGPLLSAGLLCLGSFICQLLRPGRASWPPTPPKEPGGRSCGQAPAHAAGHPSWRGECHQPDTFVSLFKMSPGILAGSKPRLRPLPPLWPKASRRAPPPQPSPVPELGSRASQAFREPDVPSPPSCIAALSLQPKCVSQL